MAGSVKNAALVWAVTARDDRSSQDFVMLLFNLLHVHMQIDLQTLRAQDVPNLGFPHG